jgi:hypothetical protein
MERVVAALANQKVSSPGLVTGAFFLLYVIPYLLLDRRPYNGRGYWRGIVAWNGWSFFWTRVMGLPLGGRRHATYLTANDADPLAEVHVKDKSKFFTKDGKPRQMIFGSHPHGVSSMHHIGLMLTPSVCKPGFSFEEVFRCRVLLAE